MEKSVGLVDANTAMMHSPFPIGAKIGKLKGKDLTDANESEDSSLLADAKSAGYTVTRVKVMAESPSLQSFGQESENNQRRQGKNVKGKRKK